MNPQSRTPRRRRVLLVLAVGGAALAATATAFGGATTAPPPVLDLAVPVAADLRVGDSEREVARIWGRPLYLARIGASVSKRFGFRGGTLGVYFRSGRVRIVEVEGVVRTTRGEVRGATIAGFRRRWGGTVFRGCCAVGVRHVRVQTSRPGLVFVATFRGGRLIRIGLMTEATFRACYVAECS